MSAISALSPFARSSPVSAFDTNLSVPVQLWFYHTYMNLQQKVPPGYDLGHKPSIMIGLLWATSS